MLTTCLDGWNVLLVFLVFSKRLHSVLRNLLGHFNGYKKFMGFSSKFQGGFHGIEGCNQCLKEVKKFHVTWHSSQLPEQKEDPLLWSVFSSDESVE